MPKITIELDYDAFDITLGKRDGDQRSFVFNAKDFPSNALTKIFAYGVQRTFNDRVGGSDKTIDDKVKEVEELIAAYKRGEIGRKAAAAVSDEVKIGRQLAKADLRKLLSAEDYKAKVSGADDTDAVLDKFIEGNAEHYRVAVAEEIKRRKAEAKKLEGITLNVNL